MKLLVVSHSCVTPINQQLYAEIERQAGWRVTIIVPENWRDEFGRTLPSARWPAFKGEVIGVPVLRSGDIILHAYKTSFRKLIKRINPDAIYVNHEPYAVATAQVYLANRLSGQRPIGFYSCQNIPKRHPPPFGWSERYVLRNSHFAFPISANVDEVLRQKGATASRAVVPLGIDTDFYRRDLAAASELRTTIAPNDRVVIGYVGRFVEAKGLRTLLQAAAKAVDAPWHLVLVGAGPMESELKRMVSENALEKRVTFSGFIPHEQIPTLLSSLDILVLPSETQSNWKEQFGRVLLEAMACGAAVIGSSSGEIPTLIQDTGGGVIFGERDSDELAGKLRAMTLDSDSRKSYAAAGSVAVIERYSIKSAAATFIDAVSCAVSLCAN